MYEYFIISMEQTYYKARTTLIQMMKDREYQHPQGLDVFNRTFTEFNDLYKGDMMDMSGITTKEGFPVYVRVINNEDEIKNKSHLIDKIKHVNSVLARPAAAVGISLAAMKDIDVEKILKDLSKLIHIIIVYRASKKDIRYDFTLETQLLDETNAEAFPVNKLPYNVTSHDLVPRHILVDEETKKAVYERYNASKLMLTKISIDDPVNLYYYGRPGDVYKILRKGYKPAYRVVVNRPLPRKK